MAKAKSKRQWLTYTFLLVEAALYVLILTGKWVISAQFASVLLCLLFVAAHLRRANYYILGALACTVCADWFLVVRGGADKVTAMLFFLAAQTLYAILLHRRVRSRSLVVTRLLAVVILEAVTVLVLAGKMNELAAVSVAYYAMLVMNIVCAFKSYKKEPLMAWALVLFFICDTFIGLQTASGTFLILPAWLNDVVFCSFNVAWACYLPSQVMLALCGKENRR
ncbi:MAG: hypothetical protein IJN04_00755 [Clostridia bacterium]|nr:hypothetical protein [Clostridia bacterium]